MKKFLKISALLLILVLSIGTFTACDLMNTVMGLLGLGDTTEEGWQPTGADVTLIKRGSPVTAWIIFGEPEGLSKDAANEFKNTLNASGVGTINSIAGAAVMNEKTEIIIGDSDRTVSAKAKALYEEQKSGLFSWVFYYYDGKLAIYSDNATAYSLAIEEFFELYCDGNALSFKDTLAECHTISEEAYGEYLDEKEKIVIDAKREENAKLISALVKKIDKQRTELEDNRTFDIRTATQDLVAAAKSSGSRDWGTTPLTVIDEHPRIMFNESDIPDIRRALREDTATNAYFYQLLESDFDGILKDVTYKQNTNSHNYSGYDLEKLMVKALAYQLYDDPYYGYQAIYALKNYLATLQIYYISGDQYRQFGDVGFTVACVYDWCYDLLTEEDKNQIIAATENVIFKGSNEKGVKFEVGFPPTQQSSVVGHGAEYQLLRDYLSFSIAIYDENPTWYNYVGARFYNDYLPSRNEFFTSMGINPQGTSYLSLRHNATIYSAWLCLKGTGTNPYEGLHQTIKSFAAYEYAPGYIFTDGDGAVTQGTDKLRDAEFMVGYLYGDSTLIALAEITLGESSLTHVTQGLGCAMYTIIRGQRTQPDEDPYENMDLVQYNPAPLGQYIVRESWKTTDSVAVFMKLKERHTANHEHGDAGAFQIYYKGMLTSEGGVYNDYNNILTQKYYKTSVSHNTLLIKNHKKNDPYNVGEQRYPKAPESINDWLTDSQYETGTVTGHEHAYTDETKSSPKYVYLAGDITKAYDWDPTSTYQTVSYVGRRMLTVYTGDEDFPMAFFVYDDISSMNVAFKKTFLLQITSKDEPEINKNKQTITTENGDGRLVLTCLTDKVTIEGVGGRVYDANGKYDPINSKNYLVNGVQLVSKDKQDDGHWGRVEISLSGAVDHTFMNVIYVTDKGQTKKAPAIKHIESDTVEGATFGEIAVLFATSRDRATTEISATVDGKGDFSYYVSGVAAGKWTVTVSTKTIGTFEATEDGGLLTFTAPAGRVKITPAN